MVISSDEESAPSNRAQQSATFSYTKARAGSSDFPDDHASDAPSNKVAEITHPTHPQELRQPRRDNQGPRPGTARSRPVSQHVADNRTGRTSTSDSESRLWDSINSTEGLGSNDEHSSWTQSQLPPSSPSSHDKQRPVITTASLDEIRALSAAYGESAEGLSYGQEAAQRLNKEQSHEGGDYVADGGTASCILQPEVKLSPATEDNKYRYIHNIYGGVLIAESACIQQSKAWSQSEQEMGPQQLHKITFVHRLLLLEVIDFLKASQAPEEPPHIKRLAVEYRIPVRLWRYGIGSLFEVLRHRLPGSLEHMLMFIHLAYSTMTLLLQIAPAFEDNWIECLGDISRYRLSLEDSNSPERAVWVGIARYWYNRAADKNPGVGRIQHHLAVLAWPDIVQQLFYYTKSLVSVRTFAGSKESIFLLFNPLWKPARPVRRLTDLLVTTFVAAHRHLYTNELGEPFMDTCDDFLSYLDRSIGEMGSNFKLQGVYIASCNFAAVLEYASPNALLIGEFFTNGAQPISMDNIYLASRKFWTPVSDLKTVEDDFLALRDSNIISPGVFYGSCLTFQTLSIMLDQVGNKNIYPSFHTTLAFLWCLAGTSGSMKRIEALVPWKETAAFLNTLTRHFTDFTLIEGTEFPSKNEDRWLPEDFLIRGQIWSQDLYPADFFVDAPTAEDGRNIEPPSRDLLRMHRCLWFGVRLAMVSSRDGPGKVRTDRKKFNRWMTYDTTSRKFSATEFTSKLNEIAQKHSPFYGKGLQKRPGTDTNTHDT